MFPRKAFMLSGSYALLLSLLIMSWNFTPIFIGVFVHFEQYNLGSGGLFWKSWHGVACAFIGVTNLAIAYDTQEKSFSASGRRLIAINSGFVFGIWGVQNTYYCIVHTDVFTPLMWINAVMCLVVAASCVHTARTVAAAPPSP